MKQKLFLTSCIAMGFVAPAVAETFPSDGYMKENKTYDNAATFENTGVYSGTVNATAEYTDIFYNIVAGNYLAAGSDDVNGTICPAGSYCSGLTHALYNATSDQGKTSCPTGYALSADGATSADECYRTCTASDVAHSKSTGTFTGMFYSNNTNACEPVNDASCENGYHYKEGSTGLNVDGMINGDSYNEDSSTMTWDTSFSYGNITGKALCSTTNGEWATTGTPDESGSGQYCWCKIDGFTPVNGSKQSLSGAWVLASRRETDNCVDGCTGLCASVCQDNLIMRGSLLGTVQSTPAMCEANTITINWSNADADDVAANNAGTATYGEDVRTPVKAETIKGKTFKGWKFSKPTTTNLPN